MNLVDKLIQADRTAIKRILIVGDGMTDIYVRGKLEDKCQEGCCKFVEEDRVTAPGGAANAKRSLERWNAKVSLFSLVAGITKTRYTVGNQCVFRHDNDRLLDRYDHIRKFDLCVVRNEAMRAIDPRQPPDAVLLSDYDKGMLTTDFIKDVARKCKGMDIPCVADVKRAPEIYAGCILKCNSDYQRTNNALLCNYLDNGRLVLTAGEMNPIIWDNGPPSGLSCNLAPVRCVNHVGAGDCFAAHMALALAHRFSLRDAAAVAHSAGRVYVQHPYNRPPMREEISADMDSARHCAL